MIPQPAFIENGTDPIPFLLVGNEANLVAVCVLSLQLFLQLVEEAPVGTLSNDLLGSARDYPRLFNERRRLS